MWGIVSRDMGRVTAANVSNRLGGKREYFISSDFLGTRRKISLPYQNITYRTGNPLPSIPEAPSSMSCRITYRARDFELRESLGSLPQLVAQPPKKMRSDGNVTARCSPTASPGAQINAPGMHRQVRRRAAICARRHNSAALNACVWVIAFSVRFRQSRMSSPKKRMPTLPATGM